MEKNPFLKQWRFINLFVFKIENQAHFASIFALNNSLFLIDDLKSSYEEVTGDVEVMSNSFIYIKKFD